MKEVFPGKESFGSASASCTCGCGEICMCDCIQSMDQWNFSPGKQDLFIGLGCFNMAQLP